MPEFEIHAAGDAALLVQAPERIDPRLNAWCIALARTLEHRVAGSIRDVVIGYCTVTVYFDPLTVDAAWLEAEVRSVAETLDEGETTGGTQVEVPVCYGDEFGPDLPDVARFGGCSEQQVIAIHSEAQYRVYMLGFVPGFAYLAEVDRRIAAPRRASPRTAVPSGSVAIAGGQTGIYPAVTPGGWNIIGRTPVKPYDPARPQPILFNPGDRVRFRAIGREEFEQLSSADPSYA